MIPWGENVHLGRSVEITNTWTLDNILQIFYKFYAMNISQTRKIFDSDDVLVKKISELLQLLLTESFVEAKLFRCTSICNMSLTNDIVDLFGTDKQISFYHIRDLFTRKCQFNCTSNDCPTNSTCGVKPDRVSFMTLHLPNAGNVVDIETQY